MKATCGGADVRGSLAGTLVAPNEVGSAAPNFNRLAGIYRWMELASFGPWLERCRFAFLNELDELGERRKALVLGDGDGRFTGRLLRANCAVRIDAVDASEAMLRALVRRAGPDAERVRTHCADIRKWELVGGQYDLVVSHFFLDCLTTEEVEALAGRVRRAVSPSAVWLVSEFAVPEGWSGRLVARPVVWGLYWAFGRLTELKVRGLPNYGAALRSSGFRLEQRREWLGGLLVSELWRAKNESARG
jgi:SAM-dependent methyltransferase